MYAVGDEVRISVGFDDGDTLSFHFLLFVFTEVNVEINTDELDMNYLFTTKVEYTAIMVTRLLAYVGHLNFAINVVM